MTQEIKGLATKHDLGLITGTHMVEGVSHTAPPQNMAHAYVTNVILKI